MNKQLYININGDKVISLSNQIKDVESKLAQTIRDYPERIWEIEMDDKISKVDDSRSIIKYTKQYRNLSQKDVDKLFEANLFLDDCACDHYVN